MKLFPAPTGRQSIACEEGDFSPEKVETWKHELASVYNRGFSTGFYFEAPGLDGFSPENDMNVSEKKRRAAGVIENYYPKQHAAAVRLLEESITIGDILVIEGSKTYLRQQVSTMKKGGKDLLKAEKGDEVGLAVDGIVRKNDRIFIIN